MNKYIDFLRLADNKIYYNYSNATALVPFKKLLDEALVYFCEQKDLELFNSDKFYTGVLDNLRTSKKFIIQVKEKYYDVADILLGYLSTVELNTKIDKKPIELFLNKELISKVKDNLLTEEHVKSILFNFLLINQYTKFYVLEVLDVKIKDSVFSNIGFSISSMTSAIVKELNIYIVEEQEDKING